MPYHIPVQSLDFTNLIHVKVIPKKPTPIELLCPVSTYHDGKTEYHDENTGEHIDAETMRQYNQYFGFNGFDEFNEFDERSECDD